MKLYVIDGNSLLFRAYFATSFTGNIMRTKEGFPTNAIFGFSNMIIKIISQMEEGDEILVAFDTGHKTFRHELMPEYKAQRKETDQDLVAQLPVAREMLKAMNIPYYEVDGYEADDIAGTCAKLGSKAGIDTICFTSDKDYLQLIDDKITVRMLRKGLTDVEDMTTEKLKEKMGLTPEQIKDYKGLMGDASDNLKGIPGVGDKTAVKLLNEFGSLENIIDAMKDSKTKVGQNIIENQEQGKKCKYMATIITDVPLPFSLNDLVYKGYNYNELSNFYSKYEFFSLVNRLKPCHINLNEEKDNVVVVENIDVIDVKKFKDIPLTSYLILDIEKGNYHLSQVNGIYFNANNEVYYLSRNKFNDPDFIKYMKDESILKKTYDFKALKVALSYLGIEVNGLDYDLTLASYLINPSLNNDPISIYGYYKINLLLKSEEVSLFEDDGEFKKMAYYLPQVEKESTKLLKEDNLLSLYKDIELPLCDILARMEIEGFPLNKKVLSEINEEYQDKLDELTNEIYSLAGYEFNIASPKQVADLLYTRLGLPHNKKESTSVEVLNELASLNPIVPLIIEYRKYSKLISTYTSGLLAYLHEDNKIHTIFNQALTQTGRLSSSDPNLQNISTRTEEGKAVRKAFFYDDDDNYMLSLDYSQVEYRVLAAMSSCQDLIDVFNKDEDIHTATAMKVFHLTKDQVTSEIRRQAKAVNFGIIYGISDWGLADKIYSSPKEAKEIIEKFYLEYPDIKNYFVNTIAKAKEKGYCETLYGRRRYIPELTSDNYMTREFGKRVCMNAPIQGSAADIMKICMIKVDQFLKENNYKTKVVLQIHDELIFKVPKEEKDIIVPLLKEVMENCVNLKVKLQVEGSLAKTWYDCK